MSVFRMTEAGRDEFLAIFTSLICSGEGWQWGPSKGYGNLTVCFNKEPWPHYCVEPPCGQLNPANPKVYEVLGKIYKTYDYLGLASVFNSRRMQ